MAFVSHNTERIKPHVSGGRWVGVERTVPPVCNKTFTHFCMQQLQHHTPSLLQWGLTAWHLTSGVPTTECDTQDAKCQAFNDLPYDII